MRFEFLFNLTGKWAIAFLQILIFKRPIMARNQSLVKRWGPEQGFRSCIADELNQKFSYVFGAG